MNKFDCISNALIGPKRIFIVVTLLSGQLRRNQTWSRERDSDIRGRFSVQVLVLTSYSNTVKEEIFVGEKFRTFPSKTFRMELNFVLSN